jgi:hypothetical protein
MRTDSYMRRDLFPPRVDRAYKIVAIVRVNQVRKALDRVVFKRQV